MPAADRPRKNRGPILNEGTSVPPGDSADDGNVGPAPTGIKPAGWRRHFLHRERRPGYRSVSQAEMTTLGRFRFFGGQPLVRSLWSKKNPGVPDPLRTP